MALNATRLAGNKATNDRWITLVNPNCVERNMLALVDQEWMLIGNTIAELIGTSPPRPTVGVVPGYDGTPAGPHGQHATAIVGRPNDFQAIGLIPGSIVMSQSFTWVSGSKPITGPSGLTSSSPIANTIVNLRNPTGTPSSFSLNPPTADQQNTVVFVNGPDGQAQIQNPAGGSWSTASMPAGAVFTIKAQNGAWIPFATADSGTAIT